MIIYASWDAWSCNMEYWQSYQSAMNRAYELAANHVDSDELSNVIQELQENGTYYGSETLPLITIEAIEVKE